MTVTMTNEDVEGIQNFLKRMKRENDALRAAVRNVLEILENEINGEPVNKKVMASCLVELRKAMGSWDGDYKEKTICSLGAYTANYK